MGRTVARKQRTPFTAIQNADLKQPTISEVNQIASTHERTSLPASQELEPKQPTSIEDAVRLRAYELYLERGAIPGDEVRDWLKAERELLTN